MFVFRCVILCFDAMATTVSRNSAKSAFVDPYDAKTKQISCVLRARPQEFLCHRISMSHMYVRVRVRVCCTADIFGDLDATADFGRSAAVAT